MPVTANELIQGRPKPITVQVDDTLESAFRLMLVNDYSALPIILEDQKIAGIITNDSILEFVFQGKTIPQNIPVSIAKRKIKIYKSDDELSDILATLTNDPCVLIADEYEQLLGIITSWDTSEFFRKQSEDFMVVKDIEAAIKDHIYAAFSDSGTQIVDEISLQTVISEVAPAETSAFARSAIMRYFQHDNNIPKKPNSTALNDTLNAISQRERNKTLDQLTLSQLVALLLSDKIWSTYKSTFTLEQSELRFRLDQVCKIRNDIAHDNREITPHESQFLEWCSEFLQDKCPSGIYLFQSQILDTELGNIDEIEEELEPTDSRYAILALYLQKISRDESRIHHTFEEIEEILGFSLPESAFKHRAWWANDSVSHVHSQEWLNAGWRVASVNMTARHVIFNRNREREAAYIEFFSELINQIKLYNHIGIVERSPIGTSWLNIGWFKDSRGVRVAHLNFSFTRTKKFRVELYIDSGDKAYNKRILDELASEADNIRLQIHEQLIALVEINGVMDDLRFERLNDNRASRIAIYTSGFITDTHDELVQLQRDAKVLMVAFKIVIETHLTEQNITYSI